MDLKVPINASDDKRGVKIIDITLECNIYKINAIQTLCSKIVLIKLFVMTIRVWLYYNLDLGCSLYIVLPSKGRQY